MSSTTDPAIRALKDAIRSRKDQMADNLRQNRVLDRQIRNLETALAAISENSGPATYARPAGVQPVPRQERKPTLGAPWLRTGSTEEWVKFATEGNLESVRLFLSESPVPVSQKNIGIGTGLNTGSLSRCITALWKLGELVYYGRDGRSPLWMLKPVDPNGSHFAVAPPHVEDSNSSGVTIHVGEGVVKGSA